jgi:hypothetical protein
MLLGSINDINLELLVANVDVYASETGIQIRININNTHNTPYHHCKTDQALHIAYVICKYFHG